jgi:hypothetical protein
VQGKRLGARQVAGSERPADRRGDAAAHRPRRQHLHQHDQRKDQRDGRQRRGSKDAHVYCFEDCHQRENQHGRQIGQGEPQQGG